MEKNDSVFALLEPLNDLAKEALEYPENAFCITTDAPATSVEPETNSRNEGEGERGQDTDTESVFSLESVESPPRNNPQQRRYFAFRFRPIPKEPHKGWLLGCDPKRCYILLTKRPSSDVSRLHARIHFHRESGHMMISDHSRTGTSVHGDRLERSSKAFASSETFVSIGQYHYLFKICVTNRLQYEKDLRAFLHHCGNTVRSLHSTLSPSPRGQERIYGGYIFRTHEQTEGAFGKVHMAVQESTGALRAIKELVRNADNKDTVSKEIRIAQGNNHVSLIGRLLAFILKCSYSRR